VFSVNSHAHAECSGQQWRGPIWFPVNILIVRSLVSLYQYFGDGFKIEFPTGSGKQVTLFEVAQGIPGRLIDIFRRLGAR
jgi:hypothetical protein